jgi:predicted nucleotidyltransferase
MNREQIIATLRAHESELKAAGVLSLSLFGSVARGESVTDSDVDVAVRLAQNFSQPGFDYFSRLNDLQTRLTEVLGCNVDVIEEPVRKERFQKNIDMDRALAF